MTANAFIPIDDIMAKKSQAVRRDPEAAPTHDLREELFELEAKGELIVQRVPEPYLEVQTKFGRTKKSRSNTPGITNRAASAGISPAIPPPSSGCTGNSASISSIPPIRPPAPAGIITLPAPPTPWRSWR